MAAALDYIPAGTSIRFDAAGSADGFSEGAVQSALNDQLSKYFQVQRTSVEAGGGFGDYFGWPFRADVVVRTREAYGDVNGPASIVAHAIYEATGYMPSVSAPSFGQPSQDSPDSGGGVLTPITDLLGGLETNARLLVLTLAVVAVVLIVRVGGRTTRIEAGI